MEKSAEPLYKMLAEDGTSPHAAYAWPLPNGKPTKWVRAKGPLRVCKNGIHLCRETDLLFWLNGPAMYAAEARGGRIDSDNKIVVREARLLHRVEMWNERTARLFACDCAERAMRRITTKHGKQDKRSWNAIKVARRFASGDAGADELAAAGDAAWAAVWTAARVAARAAAWAAAGDAVWAAAKDAAGAAVWATAGDAEREWQTQHLMTYLRGEI